MFAKSHCSRYPKNIPFSFFSTKIISFILVHQFSCLWKKGLQKNISNDGKPFKFSCFWKNLLLIFIFSGNPMPKLNVSSENWLRLWHLRDLLSWEMIWLLRASFIISLDGFLSFSSKNKKKNSRAKNVQLFRNEGVCLLSFARKCWMYF